MKLKNYFKLEVGLENDEYCDGCPLIYDVFGSKFCFVLKEELFFGQRVHIVRPRYCPLKDLQKKIH